MCSGEVFHEETNDGSTSYWSTFVFNRGVCLVNHVNGAVDSLEVDEQL